MATDRMGHATPQTDARRPFSYFWPKLCELPDCADDMSGRVRVAGVPVYLCGKDMDAPRFRRLPARDKDYLR